MGTRVYLVFFIGWLLVSCQEENDAITHDDFIVLMNNIAEGWSTQNTELALGSFDGDAVYMEPPNVQYYRGHGQLRPYFDALGPEHEMKFHNLWFNEATQTGAGEFTFGHGGEMADIGMVVVELEAGKIKFWREYPRKGPTNFEEFKAVNGKNWEWHIGNYPEPKDTLVDQN